MTDIFTLLNQVGQFSAELPTLTADAAKLQAAITVALDKTIDAANAWKAVNAAVTPIVAAVKNAE